MVDEVAEEHGLALLAQAEHGVQLGTGLARHDRTQKLDVTRRGIHFDHEIGAGKENRRLIRQASRRMVSR